MRRIAARFFGAFDNQQFGSAFLVTGEERGWDEASVWAKALLSL
jgi:hypothetical protein